MSSEVIVTDGEGNQWSLDNYGTQKWLEGHYSGLDSCTAWLNEQSTQLFIKRKTEQAIEMQRLADRITAELRPKLVERAKVHREEFPSKVKK